jgi:hypothetical protein
LRVEYCCREFGSMTSNDPALAFLLAALFLASMPLALVEGLRGSPAPTPLPVWTEVSFYNWPIGPGILNASVYGPVYVTTPVRSIYLSGSVEVTSWTHSNGTGNVSGSCKVAPSLCSVYIGIFTSNGWRAFVNTTIHGGGLAPPIWCYSNPHGQCMNTSQAAFLSPDLNGYAQGWNVVEWTNASVELFANLTLEILYTR